MRLKTQHATIDRGTNILNIEVPEQLKKRCTLSYTHLTLPTIYSV